MPPPPTRELVEKLSRIGSLRGIVLIALGIYLLVRTIGTQAAVARAAGAYWIVDGLVALWAAAAIAVLAMGRVMLVVRGVIAVVAGVTLFALPLDIVFGPWQAGQTILLLVVASFMLTAVGLQIAAGVIDVVVCLRVRQRIPGDWSFALSAVVSIALGIVVVATLAVPATLLARVLGAGAVIGGIGLLAGAVRLRGAAAHSPLSAYPHHR